MDRERLSENLLLFVPLLHKKLMRGMLNIGISRQQLELLFIMNKNDEEIMSFYSEKMMIPKSNLTLIANKLIEEGLIERTLDPNNRRIIKLKITEKGREYLKDYKQKFKTETAKKLESLSDNDVKRLNELVEEMRSIFEQLE